MKTTTSSLLALTTGLLFSASVATAAVSAGDIAFVGVNASTPDQFAILVRNTISAGDSFFVTDGGFTGNSGAASAVFRATEGFLQYTAPAGGIAAGSVLLFTAGEGVSANAAVARNGGGSAGTVSLLLNGSGSPNNTNFSFSTSGDSLTAYTVSGGTHLTGTPSLIAFIGFGASPYGSGSAQASSTPSISGGQVLVVGNFDNTIITSTASVNAFLSITTLSNASNFSSRETTGYDLSSIPSTAIPEPASAVALAGLGILGFAATRRRRA